MKKVQLNIAKAIDWNCRLKIGQGIQLGLLFLPIEATLPVSDQAFNICQRGTQVPGRVIQLITLVQ